MSEEEKEEFFRKEKECPSSQRDLEFQEQEVENLEETHQPQTEKNDDNKLEMENSSSSETLMNLEKFYRQPTDQWDNDVCRLTVDRIINYPKSEQRSDVEPTVEFRRLSSTSYESRYKDFMIADCKVVWRVYLWQFDALIALGVFRILQAEVNKIMEAAEKNLPDFATRFVMPMVRIAKTNYGMDISYQGDIKVKTSDTAIPAGYFVQIRRLKRQGDTWAYEPPSVPAAGLRLGAKAFGQIYKRLFLSHEEGRETFGDGTRIPITIISAGRGSLDDEEDEWESCVPQATKVEQQKCRFDVNLHQSLLAEVLKDHKTLCNEGSCRACKINEKRIENFDRDNRGKALREAYSIPVVETLLGLGWIKSRDGFPITDSHDATPSTSTAANEHSGKSLAESLARRKRNREMREANLALFKTPATPKRSKSEDTESDELDESMIETQKY